MVAHSGVPARSCLLPEQLPSRDREKTAGDSPTPASIQDNPAGPLHPQCTPSAPTGPAEAWAGLMSQPLRPQPSPVSPVPRYQRRTQGTALL